jgi:SOS-response transcriptional repressor LexA
MQHTIQETLVDCQQVKLFEGTRKACNNSKMSTGDRIKQAREAAGYTQKELAKLLGVEQQSVQQWESGDTRHPKKINEIAGILGVSVEYLLAGNEGAINFPYPIAARCPLIGWQDAKMWPQNRSFLKESEKLSYPTKNIILKSDCYMLQIEDKSMVNYMEAKGFQEGSYIIIDPNRSYENGNFIVAKKPNLSKLLFRQYINDGESEYLTPLNIAHYKRMDLSPDIEICGVVIAYLDILI